jgi:hypothetical protein
MSTVHPTLMERLGWITTTAELAELAEIPVV